MKRKCVRFRTNTHNRHHVLCLAMGTFIPIFPHPFLGPVETLAIRARSLTLSLSLSLYIGLHRYERNRRFKFKLYPSVLDTIPRNGLGHFVRRGHYIYCTIWTQTHTQTYTLSLSLTRTLEYALIS